MPNSVENAKNAAKKLMEQGAHTVLVKLEGGGCVTATNESIFYVPAVPVDVVDGTGAGDAFAAALATAVQEKCPLKEAACFASAASLAAVSGYGSQPAYPTREQIGHYYDQTISNIQEL